MNRPVTTAGLSSAFQSPVTVEEIKDTVPTLGVDGGGRIAAGIGHVALD